MDALIHLLDSLSGVSFGVVPEFAVGMGRGGALGPHVSGRHIAASFYPIQRPHVTVRIQHIQPEVVRMPIPVSCIHIEGIHGAGIDYDVAGRLRQQKQFRRLTPHGGFGCKRPAPASIDGVGTGLVDMAVGGVAGLVLPMAQVAKVKLLGVGRAGVQAESLLGGSSSGTSATRHPPPDAWPAYKTRACSVS